MRKRNGFVLAETLIVVILLTITLMTLYSGFSSIIYKARNKNNNDTIDTIYKTYYIKELLDNAYSYSYINDSEGAKEYSNSFEYYANYMKDTTGLNNICSAYDYSTSTKKVIEDNENLMIVCNYEAYLSNSSPETYSSDYMYNAIKSYGIEKMYLINFEKINGSRNYTKIMNRLDASTIDYISSKSKKISGNYLVIKFKNKHSYPNDFIFEDTDNFLIKEDAYHSSVILTGVVKASSTSPIYLYESNEVGAKYMETEPLNLNDEYILKSNNNFENHNGKVIVGWTNSTDYINLEDFNTCLTTTAEYKKQSKSYYKETGILCGQIGEIIKFNEDTKVLYAVWCGTGKLDGALECQANYNKDSKNGLFIDTGLGNKYNDYNYVYRGKVSDNFIRIGDVCYSMTSTFGSSNSMKIAYYGPYNTTTEACDKKTAYGTNVAFNSTISAGWAWMYSNSLTVSNTGSSLGAFAEKLKLYELYPTSSGISPTETVVCKNGKECYFGNDVIYDPVEKMYTLVDENNNEVTKKLLFGGYDASGYATLGNSEFYKKYICEGGQTTKCEKVYYYYSKSGSGASTLLRYKIFKNGIKEDNYQTQKIFLSNKISYSDGKYILSNTPEDSIQLTISELKSPSTKIAEYDNKTVGELLYTYKYSCDDWLVRESNDYSCDKANYIVSSFGYITYYVLKDGVITDDEIYDYINGSLEKGNRTRSSTIKTNIDNFYASKLASHESLIDKNATFCNNLETSGGFNNKRNSQFYVRYKAGYSTFYPNAYKDCDSKGEYLYSMSGASSGNNLLTYPIGLLTAEEVTYLGSQLSVTNTSHYLTTGDIHVLMTPMGVYTTYELATYGFNIRGNGELNDWAFSTSGYTAKPTIRIFIDKDVVSGSGTYNSPFVLKES